MLRCDEASASRRPGTPGSAWAGKDTVEVDARARGLLKRGSLTPTLTPKRLDGRLYGAWTQWKNPGNSVSRCPPGSIDFRLPTVRNQQVVGSSPTAGSRFSNLVIWRLGDFVI